MGMQKGIQLIGSAIIGMIVILVVIQLIGPIATGVSDVTGLAILGSFSGTAALMRQVPLLAAASVLVLGLTVLLLPATRERAISAVRRRMR